MTRQERVLSQQISGLRERKASQNSIRETNFGQAAVEQVPLAPARQNSGAQKRMPFAPLDPTEIQKRSLYFANDGDDEDYFIVPDSPIVLKHTPPPLAEASPSKRARLNKDCDLPMDQDISESKSMKTPPRSSTYDSRLKTTSCSVSSKGKSSSKLRSPRIGRSQRSQSPRMSPRVTKTTGSPLLTKVLCRGIERSPSAHPKLGNSSHQSPADEGKENVPASWSTSTKVSSGKEIVDMELKPESPLPTDLANVTVGDINYSLSESFLEVEKLENRMIQSVAALQNPQSCKEKLNILKQLDVIKRKQDKLLRIQQSLQKKLTAQQGEAKLGEMPSFGKTHELNVAGTVDFALDKVTKMQNVDLHEDTYAQRFQGLATANSMDQKLQKKVPDMNIGVSQNQEDCSEIRHQIEEMSLVKKDADAIQPVPMEPSLMEIEGLQGSAAMTKKHSTKGRRRSAFSVVSSNRDMIQSISVTAAKDLPKLQTPKRVPLSTRTSLPTKSPNPHMSGSAQVLNCASPMVDIPAPICTPLALRNMAATSSSSKRRNSGPANATRIMTQLEVSENSSGRPSDMSDGSNFSPDITFSYVNDPVVTLMGDSVTESGTTTGIKDNRSHLTDSVSAAVDRTPKHINSVTSQGRISLSTRTGLFHKNIPTVNVTNSTGTVKATPSPRPTSIGSLSLSANMSYSSIFPHTDSHDLRSCLFTATAEKYFDALLDDEVSLYSCRLRSRCAELVEERCPDPVAAILSDGDETVSCVNMVR